LGLCALDTILVENDPTTLCLKRLGQSISWELRKVPKDGSELWVRETARAAPRVNRPIVLIACENITERKRAEEALRHAPGEFAHVSRVTTMGELTATLAHEVNQPLSAVVANGNACLRSVLTDPPNLARRARRLKESPTMAEMLEKSCGSGRSSSELPVRRLPSIWMVSSARCYASCAVTQREGALLWKTDLDKNLPSVGDRVQLQQVLLNLVLSGIEAMDPIADRPKKLFIRSAREIADAAIFEIRDHGVGMKDPERAFEAFFTTEENGMGMGLAICCSIIDAHHGRLWVASSEGPGARVSFTIPFQSSGAP